MQPSTSRVLVCLAVLCSLMAVGYAAGGCCGYGTSGVYASTPSLSYSKYRDSVTPNFNGYVSLPYSSSCGDCITASFNLNNEDNCNFQGKLPKISSYKCVYYLTNINEFARRQKRNGIPCSYNSYVTQDINATHYESCSVSYIGVANADFDITGPKGTARVECKSLSASPKSCYIYRI